MIKRIVLYTLLLALIYVILTYIKEINTDDRPDHLKYRVEYCTSTIAPDYTFPSEKILHYQYAIRCLNQR